MTTRAVLLALLACRPKAGSEPAGPPAPSNSPPAASEQPPILVAHNEVRAEVGVVPLRWSAVLAEAAQRWANVLARRGCRLEHNPRGRYGENLYAASPPGPPRDAVASWAEEKRDYDARRNRCTGTCGHYTQVVWSRSTEVGCASARCGPSVVWVCNYDPPGNFVGEKPF